MTAENDGKRPAAAPPDWQNWQQWVEGVDWSDWRSWLRRVSSTDWGVTDWAAAPWAGSPWEQPSGTGTIPLTLRAFAEDEPGDQIAAHLRVRLAGVPAVVARRRGAIG